MKNKLNSELNTALTAHQNGRLQTAQRLYHKFITKNPDDSTACYLLGSLYQDTGRVERAKEYLNRSINLNPNMPESQNARGINFKESGEINQAIGSFKKALLLNPNFAEALTNLADSYRLIGETKKSLHLNGRAIELKPHLATARNNQGIIEKELGILHQAKASFELALELDGTLIDAAINLSTTHRLLGNKTQALKFAKYAYRMGLKYAPAQNCLGVAYFDLGKISQAQNHFEGACSINPRYSDAHNNLANTLTRQNKFHKAHKHYDIALKWEPKSATYWTNKAAAFQAENKIGATLNACEKALIIEPDNADAKWNRGIAHLISGNYQKGFSDYEARWLLPEFKLQKKSEPLWDGQDLNGKSILLHSEQGYGDTIQFIRYAKLVKQSGAGKILLETHPPLIKLLSQIPYIDKIYKKGFKNINYDLQIPLMSLPRVFNTTLKTIPVSTAYLKAQGPSPYDFKPANKKDSVLRVGIVWAGRKTHKNDYNRSMRFDHFKSIIANVPAEFFSLQLGKKLDAESIREPVIDLQPYLKDFASTAMVIQSLDLLITVDTAIAHLAGAMGLDCWLLLPFAPDWRWQLVSKKSIWYPSIRLFRQSKPENWKNIISLLNKELKNLCVSNGTL